MTVEQHFAACEGCDGKGLWNHLDRHVSECLKQAGFAPHVHGDVTHHHAYDVRSFLWPPPSMGDRTAEEVFGDTRPPRDMPAHGSLGPDGATGFAVELLARGQEAVAAQAPALEEQAAAEPDSRHAALWAPPAAYQTDKVAQGYMGVYREIAAELGPSARVCELGVCGRRVAGHLAGPVPGGPDRRGGHRPGCALAGRHHPDCRLPG